MLSSILAAIPQPPVNDVMPKTAETVFNIFIFIPLGIALAVAVRHLIGGKGPLLLYCIIGGALAATMEPVVDVLGLVFLKENNALGTFTVLGRTMPLYICFVYPWYVGGMGYLTYKLFDRGIDRKGMFQLWALIGVVDVLLESPGIILHTYLYYGHQPFDIWGFPLWWGFVNPVMPITAGALIYKIRPHVAGSAWKMLAIIPLIPMADGIANGAAGLPMFVSLNQPDVSYFWTYLAGFATLALALYCVWMVSLVVARPTEDLAPETLVEKLKAVAGIGGSEVSAPVARPADRQPVGSVG